MTVFSLCFSPQVVSINEEGLKKCIEATDIYKKPITYVQAISITSTLGKWPFSNNDVHARYDVIVVGYGTLQCAPHTS